VRDSVRAAFVPFTAPLEGVVPWMYLDVKGLVTVAIGNLIDPIQYALPLPFLHADGRIATRDQIAAEWLRVKHHPLLAKYGHRAAEKVTTLRLDAMGIDLVVSRKLNQNADHLRRRFVEWEEWPACAQLATLSMAWACGPAFRFPMLAAALNSQDWELAAQECHIDETNNPGIVPRNVRNKMLYRNAARVRAFHLDPDALNWETDYDVTQLDTQPEIANPASEPTICVTEPKVWVDPSAYLRPKEFLDGLDIEIHDDDGED